MTTPAISAEKARYLNSLRQDIAFSETLRGEMLQFQTTWGLFSPKSIDEGSRLLLDYMEVGENDDTLDLGCGYGPLGLTLARLAPNGTSVLVDKDYVAVEYSRKNAELNGIRNTEIFLSNGFSEVGNRQFDLIASNLPAKTGKELYYLYFYDALMRMKPGARFYVVTITGLRKFIQKAFIEVFGNYEKLKQGKTYTVAVATLEK
ncbi:class I SAM-dependent methyltransferase [Sedimenticola selenatireducens]|jgi:16S rRNA G1207 methylase RsmC|uniref:Class I SAM-dependent methyltransferase n=1 Tax=Sedimenticola selenatireducens TaxID=191960 RepID=A0A558DSJ6_9GAMM|nr:methyltransferase [Sedimenticola selenatireducens]TVO76573.1 class I SAM-dependent methyltransferase [Sedimenticola selenatireducens]TVT64017.1 MAG: class I SAM-dependent methyltransferase [Sedimenticola selenatireducens]